MWAIAAGAGLSAYSQLKGGREDAKALREQAATAQRQSLRDEEAHRRAARQVLGSQAAAMAQAGGGIDEGVIRQSAANAELDALNIRYGGQMKARGLLAEASAVKRQSKLLAAATLLSGGGSYYAQRKLSRT